MPAATLTLRTLELASAQLRADFDESFTERPAPRRAQVRNFLILRVGTHTYAAPLTEIRGLYRDTPVLELPSAVAPFIGITRVNRVVAPVYDLRVLLGQSAPEHPARWLILAAGATAVALAFDSFERQVQVSTADLIGPGDAQSGKFVRGAVEEGNDRHALLHLPALIQTLEPHR